MTRKCSLIRFMGSISSSTATLPMRKQDPQLVDHTQIFIAGARGEFLGQVDLFRQKREALFPLPANPPEDGLL